MNVHRVNHDGPADLKALVHFQDHAAPGLFLAPNKVAQYPKNFREIARLLSRVQGDNKTIERAQACAKWLQYEADDLGEFHNG